MNICRSDGNSFRDGFVCDYIGVDAQNTIRVLSDLNTQPLGLMSFQTLLKTNPTEVFASLTRLF